MKHLIRQSVAVAIGVGACTLGIIAYMESVRQSEYLIEESRSARERMSESDKEQDEYLKGLVESGTLSQGELDEIQSNANP